MSITDKDERDEFMPTQDFMGRVEEDIGTQHELKDLRMNELLKNDINNVREIA
jgi:hypothetical protein